MHTQLIWLAFLVCSLAVGCGGDGTQKRKNGNNANDGASDAGNDRADGSNDQGTTNSSNTTGSNNTANNRSGVGEPCVNGGIECEAGLICQSDEEARWNFCGAQMEPDCADGFVGDDCGNCFEACTTLEECPEAMTCNGNFCIGQRTCREEQLAPP